MNVHEEIGLEQLWKIGHFSLKASDFNTAMVHFYRAEVTRANTWRNRLDQTTNWAVVTTSTAITFAFNGTQSPSVVLILITLLVLLFLFIEARRYRYYEIWMDRVRIYEQYYMVGLLSPHFEPDEQWVGRIKEALLHPRFTISLLEAFGRRYRRNYAPILFLLALAWLLKIYIHPFEAQSFAEFMQRASIGPFSGWFVLGLGFFVHGIVIFWGFVSLRLNRGSDKVEGEERNLFGDLGSLVRSALSEVGDLDIASITPPAFLDRRKQMAFIISDQADEIGRILLNDLQRGVTKLQGTGLYTGKEHPILMCTIEARQLPKLRENVFKVDPKAFVSVTLVQDVRGGGFRPLDA